MPWANTQPSWLRDMNPWRAFGEAEQAMEQAALAPLRYQQAQNQIKKQVLDIAHQGIENQLESKRLDFEMQTMPDKVKQIDTQTKIQELELDKANKQRQWQTQDAETLHKWKSTWLNSTWEDRLNMQIPDLHDANATKDAVTFRAAQMQTWDAQQAQDDRVYFLKRLDSLTPDQRAMVKTVKDPQSQIVALQRFEQENIALAEKKAREKQERDIEGRKAVAEIGAKAREKIAGTQATTRLKVEEIRQQGLNERYKRNPNEKRLDFQNRHINAYMKQHAKTKTWEQAMEDLGAIFDDQSGGVGSKTKSKPEIKTVKTKAERDALPSGTPYIGPDGKQYIKQ